MWSSVSDELNALRQNRCVAAAFYIGLGLRYRRPFLLPTIAAPIYAGDTTSESENTETLFTSSVDEQGFFDVSSECRFTVLPALG